jgi:uncharacterized protein (TIGR03435 family)
MSLLRHSRRAFPLLALALTFRAGAQAPAAAHPELETAAIALADPAANGDGIGTDARRANIVNLPVASLILLSYDLEDSQLIDVPAWAKHDRYNITVVASGSDKPTWQQWQAIFRTLLADRFHLRLHEETRELAIESLTLAKGGPHLKSNLSGSDGNTDDRMNGHGDLSETNTTMAGLALRLARIFHRPVVDNTGLGEKRFDLTLRWRDVMQADDNGAGDTASLPDIRTALTEQLGLRVTGAHGAARVLVIDSLDHPTPN